MGGGGAIGVAGLAAACVSAADGPSFSTAAFAPPDVQLYVRVEDASALRTALAGRPLAQGLKSWLDGSQLPAAWSALAAEADVAGPVLFEQTLGRDVTLLRRGGEWAVAARMDPPRAQALLKSLGARVLGPRHETAIYELADQDLVLARSGPLVIVAPRRREALFDDLVANLARAPQRSLADETAIERARGWDAGPVQLFMRHEPPLGGWTVAVAGLDGQRLRLRSASRFEDAPFTDRITELRWDPAPLPGFAGSTILAWIEPTDTAGGPFDAFVSVLLGEPTPAAHLGDNLGPRRVTAVSEIDGRLEDPPFDALLPTVARAWEVEDVARARAQLDDYVVRLLGALERLGESSFDLAIPDPATWSGREGGRAARRVPVGPFARWLFGDLPGVARIELCWTVVPRARGEAGGGWCVIASHRSHLDAVADALRAPPAEEAVVGRWTSVGMVDGGRLARHLGTWGARADLLAKPGAEGELRDALALFGELAGGLDDVRWRLARPSAECAVLEVEAALSPPDSADAGR